MRNPSVATFGVDRLAPRCACETEAAAWRESPVPRQSSMCQMSAKCASALHVTSRVTDIENELQVNNKRRRFQQVVFGCWPRLLSNAGTRTKTG
jgi:hypothetical protein